MSKPIFLFSHFQNPDKSSAIIMNDISHTVWGGRGYYYLFKNKENRWMEIETHLGNMISLRFFFLLRIKTKCSSDLFSPFILLVIRFQFKNALLLWMEIFSLKYLNVFVLFLLELPCGSEILLFYLNPMK